MAIDIGDAILTFTGDTTQLDAAYERAGVEGPAKLAPASAAIEQVAGDWQFAGATASTAGAEMLGAGEEGAEGAEVLRASTHEAVGEAALLSEATGVRLPRHVRSFLATLPGVSEALSGAFAATAVLFLIEALVKGTEKLTEWISDTFIFTEAQKALTNELLDSNKAVEDYNKQLDELIKKNELIGAKGSQRTAIEFSFSVKDEQETEAKIRDIRNDIFALNQGWERTTELIPVVNRMITQLHEGMKEDDLKKLLLPDDATKEQVVSAFSGIQAELNAKLKTLQQSDANSEKTFDDQRLQEAKALADKQQRITEQLYFAIAKAREQAGKVAEKSAEDDAKIIEFRGNQALKGEQERAAKEIELQKQKIQATADALKHSESDAKVETAVVTEQYSQQEKAVQLLSSFKLLSATQASHQLELLYTQESQKLLAILNALLRKEEDAVKAAQAQLTAAQNNPFMSPQQVEELKKLLLQAEQAEAATQVRISTTRKQFQDRQLTLDKGHYGQALALAVAFGKSILAEQLQENHAQLLAAQNELLVAKARGEDTTAIQKKIAVMKQHEQELQKEANGNKQLIAQHLQLIHAQILAAQAVLADAKARGLDTTAIEKQIADLKKLQAELQITTQGTHTYGKALDDLKQEMDSLGKEAQTAFASALEAMVQGTESFSQAMKKMIGQLAESTGKYFAARGIADLFFNPALGAAEIAAAAALFAVAGALGTGGSSSSGGSKESSASSSNATITQNASTAASPQPVTTVNIPRLAGGGLIEKQTLAIVGDAPSGGNQREAVIPLDDARAKQALASLFGGEFGGGGDTYHYHINGLQFTTKDMTTLSKRLSRDAQTGRGRVTVANSSRVTRKS